MRRGRSCPGAGTGAARWATATGAVAVHRHTCAWAALLVKLLQLPQLLCCSGWAGLPVARLAVSWCVQVLQPQPAAAPGGRKSHRAVLQGQRAQAAARGGAQGRAHRPGGLAAPSGLRQYVGEETRSLYFCACILWKPAPPECHPRCRLAPTGSNSPTLSNDEPTHPPTKCPPSTAGGHRRLACACSGRERAALVLGGQ